MESIDYEEEREINFHHHQKSLDLEVYVIRKRSGERPTFKNIRQALN